MRIGILTYHRSQNYGSYMQARALAEVIRERTGAETELIDYNSPAAERFYLREIFRDKTPGSILYNLKKYRMFLQAVGELPLSSGKLVTSDLDKIRFFLSGRYDVIVVGSDEIWKLDGTRGFPNAYWLPGVTGCAKMSCAASARQLPGSVSPVQRKTMSELLESFRFVSVRDEVTRDLVNSALPEGREAALVCDPTLAQPFAFDRAAGKRLLRDKFHVDPGKKVLGIMVNRKSLAKQITDAYGNRIQIVSLFYSYPGTRSCPGLTPAEWAQVIGALDGLITTFFHGMCFAINADTPFLIIEQRDIPEARFSKSYDLLARNGAEDRYLQANTAGSLQVPLDRFVRDVLEGAAADFTAIRQHERQSFEIFLDALKSYDRERTKP